MPKKLIVIDTSDYIGYLQAVGAGNDDATILSVGSWHEFADGIDRLIRRGIVFDRLVFRTHGDTSAFWFGKTKIFAGNWRYLSTGINFPALFPGSTKVYFDACNTAEGEEGTRLLTAAGQTLLRAGGGSISGWSSGGFALPGFLGGHTLHFPNYENLKTLHFKPGGVLWSPPAEAAPSHVDVWGDQGKYQKPNIGNKI